MNIFGFLAVIMAGIASVIITALLCKCGITIHRTSEDVTKRPQIATSIEVPEKKTSTETSKTKEDDSVKNMDAVIRAANELMGIGTIEKEDK